MGPCKNLTIAPAFYYRQVDLFGPYNVYSIANKRATVKIWFVIFAVVHQELSTSKSVRITVPAHLFWPSSGIDLITPNRLLLARNNERCPTGSVTVTEIVEKIIRQTNDIFEVWFRSWLISYLPSEPKWFKSDRDPKVGDVVLFLKSDREFDKQYQYGLIKDLKISRDGKIRQVEVEYQNFSESVKRTTTRGTRELVVIHPADELGLIRELNVMFKTI